MKSSNTNQIDEQNCKKTKQQQAASRSQKSQLSFGLCPKFAQQKSSDYSSLMGATSHRFLLTVFCNFLFKAYFWTCYLLHIFPLLYLVCSIHYIGLIYSKCPTKYNFQLYEQFPYFRLILLYIMCVNQ